MCLCLTAARAVPQFPQPQWGWWCWAALARCLGHRVPQERWVQHTGIYDIFLLLCLGNELHKINSRFIIKRQDLETEAFPWHTLWKLSGSGRVSSKSSLQCRASNSIVWRDHCFHCTGEEHFSPSCHRKCGIQLGLHTNCTWRLTLWFTIFCQPSLHPICV